MGAVGDTGGMGTLVYTAIASLDGYVVDADGDFSWAAPTAEVHAAVNDLERPLATQLLGRRMYEVLAFWEDPDPASLKRLALRLGRDGRIVAPEELADSARDAARAALAAYGD